MQALTGSPRVLVQSERNRLLEVDSGSPFVVRLPLNSDQAIGSGSLFTVTRVGTGSVTIEAVAGVTLNGVDGGSAVLARQWSAVTIYKRATNAWAVAGDIL